MQRNENEVFDCICDSIADAESDYKVVDDNAVDLVWRDELCKTLIGIERKALKKLEGFIKRDREAMDLKTYYAERRLKELNLDQPYEFEGSDNLNEFGALPGGEIDF